MPVARFVCPYCDKDAEVQVTSVTRSRPCPHCSKGVVIQVAARDRKNKHRALLIAPDKSKPLVIEDADVKPVPGPAYEPMPLEGEVFERMKMDPEVRVFRRRLFVGVAVMILLVIGTCVWSVIGPQAELPIADTGIESPTVPPPQPPVTSTEQATPAIEVERTDKAEAVAAVPSPKNGILAFKAPGEATTAPKPVPATSNPSTSVMVAVEKFLQAENVDQLLETVAARAAVEAAIREHTAVHGRKPVAYKALDMAPANLVPAGCTSAVVVTLQDGSQRNACVVSEAGGPKVDWPSFVAHSEMEWTNFTDKKPSSPLLFRVLLTEGERFDHGFNDPEALRCVKVLNPNDVAGRPLFAYAEKSSNVGQELDFLLRQSSVRPMQMTLRLRYPADPATPDQVWVDSVVASGWVTASVMASTQAAILAE